MSHTFILLSLLPDGNRGRLFVIASAFTNKLINHRNAAFSDQNGISFKNARAGGEDNSRRTKTALLSLQLVIQRNYDNLVFKIAIHAFC